MLDGHAPRTFSLRPPAGLELAGLWLIVCSCAAPVLDSGLVQWAALVLGLTAGVTCLVAAFALHMRHVRFRREVARVGAAPWAASGLWNPDGTTLTSPVRARYGQRGADPLNTRTLLGIAALVVLNLMPTFGWRCVVLAVYVLGIALVRPRKPVAARIAFAKFPSFVGERARFRVTLARRPPAEPFDEVSFTLRCVSETRRLGGWVWPQTRCIAEISGVPAATAARDTGPYEIEFDLPADAPGTDLLGRPAVYWELVVEATSPWWRYEQAFQVPVYAAARAPLTT